MKLSLFIRRNNAMLMVQWYKDTNVITIYLVPQSFKCDTAYRYIIYRSSGAKNL
jgi:hypothetical protein